MKADQSRVGALLIDTVSLLCRNGLNFTTDIKVQGLLGITVDGSDVFLVHFNETLTESQASTSVKSQPDDIASTSTVKKVTPKSFNDNRAKSNLRKVGFQSYLHRQKYGSLPLGMQAKKRFRQVNISTAQKTNNSELLKRNDISRSSDFNQIRSSSDEKIKPEVYDDDDMGRDDHPSNEDDDVILVESEEGNNEERHLTDNSSVRFKRRNLIRPMKYESKAEHTEEGDVSDGLMYSYSGSSFNLPNSNRKQVSSSFANIDDDDDGTTDIKPTVPSSSESWGEMQSDWRSNDSSWQMQSSDWERQPISQSSSAYRQSAKKKSHNHDELANNMTAVLEPRSRRLPSRGQTTGLDLEGVLPASTAYENTHPSALGSWSAKAGMVTSYVCKICGAAMGHRRSLLRHQINVHGRQKQKRGRPPSYILYA